MGTRGRGVSVDRGRQGHMVVGRTFDRSTVGTGDYVVVSRRSGTVYIRTTVRSDLSTGSPQGQRDPSGYVSTDQDDAGVRGLELNCRSDHRRW